MSARGLVVALTGPTGVGKSAVALALARQLDRPVELISADSAQVYRGMDIGTAKPDVATRARWPHHLIDIRDPREAYSAGDFAREARAAIDSIHARGALPVIVGGTLLYLRALYEGLAPLPAANAAVRAALDAHAQAAGWPALHAELASIDPPAAARIAPQDAQRIQRALEVYRLSGRTITQWQRQTRGASGEYRWLRYALLPAARGELRQGLARRFDAMLERGLVAEVRALYARGDLAPSMPALRAVGYRQLWPYVAGAVELAAARAAAITATAQLAKRQLTWLRREPAWTPIIIGAGERAGLDVVESTGRSLAAQVRDLVVAGGK